GSDGGTDKVIYKNIFAVDTSITIPTDNIYFKNIETDLSTHDEFEKARSLLPKYKTAFKLYFEHTNNPFATSKLKKSIIDRINAKLDVWGKAYEVTYYQSQYEDTHQTIWLDKKQQALNEYHQLVAEFNALPNPTSINASVINEWKAENIDAIVQRNNITTATLTSELEKALGINKNAIAEKEAEIARLKTAADQAKSTYDNTNPSAADLALSQRYEEIMRQLTAKANELKSEQDRLQALRDALTLHDLTNVGENAYAIGTNALATGTNSLAIGTDTIVTGENSIAMGKGSVVTGTNSIAIGTGHNVLGNNSGAFGDPDYIYGDDSYAFGNNNTIGEATNPHNSGNNTFVLGSNVVTKANNAVIIGANSTDGGDNTVSVGSSTAQRKIVYIANGAISQTSKDAINGSQIYDILQNATDINVASWQAKLGTGTNTAGNTGLTTGDTLNAALSNVSAKLKVIAGTNTTVTTGTDGDYQTYAVNVSNDAIKAAIQTDLDSKANANASNITGDNKTAWQAALGDGQAEAGNTGLITGNTLHTALSTKADKTDITNINNTLNSKANTADVDTALAKKANTDASNLTTTNIQSWQEKLGTGTNTAGDKGLITGDTLHTALSTKADKTDITNINTALENKANSADVDTALAKKANVDASNINVAKFAEKLGTGIVEAGNTNLVTGGTVATALENKANTNLSNITNTAKTVIKNLAKDAVKVVKGTNTTVTTSTDGDTTTYAVNVSDQSIKNVMQSDMNTKANTDASNINTEKFAEKLGTGTVSENDTNLVTGKTVYTAIQRAAINGADVSNKANRSANNLTAQDVQKWQNKLGTDKVAKNSKQLVTSGAVHSYVHDMTRNTLAQANTYTDMRINGLQQHTDKQIKRLKEETRSGIASAMAMGAIPTVSNKRYSVGAGTATFSGESAVAIGLRVKSDKDNAIVSFSASASSNGDIAGAAGFAFGF
ncbi:YadA-like family protein, partial [Gallibacterium anatis]